MNDSFTEGLTASYVTPTLTSMGLAYPALGGMNTLGAQAAVGWPANPPGWHPAVESVRDILHRAAQSLHEPTTDKEMRVMAKLIRYTVVDPDLILAEKLPDKCLLSTGMAMVNGSDAQGFLMELAPKLAEQLAAHNKTRAECAYTDKDGKAQVLSPIRLGQLDVVIETVKEYKG